MTGHHPYHRPRRDSDSRSDDSSSTSATSATDSRQRRRSSSERRQSRRDDYIARSSSSSDAANDETSSSASSSDDDEDEYRYASASTARHYDLVASLAMLLLFAVAAVLFFRQRDSAAEAALPSPSTSSPSQAGVGDSTPESADDSSTEFPSPSISAPAASASSKSTAAASPSGSSAGGSSGPYKLVTSYQGETFFDGWTFWDQADPTHGQVEYLSRDAAQAAGLISTTAKSAIMRVDNKTKLAAGAQRASVRIHSTKAVPINSIVIADFLRMPFGCATWPAWWSNGPNWPDGGEIDIIEGVNNDEVNQLTLHTKDSGCKLDSKPDITGKPVPANTDCNAHNNGNTGCSWAETAADSYGEKFNAAGGGVLATLFSDDAISIWFWSHGGTTLPENIANNAPDMSTWGKPSATWTKAACAISKYFQDQTLILNTSICGDWAGAQQVWSLACGKEAPTCSAYVADASHFDNAVWEIASIKVYSIG